MTRAAVGITVGGMHPVGRPRSGRPSKSSATAFMRSLGDEPALAILPSGWLHLGCQQSRSPGPATFVIAVYRLPHDRHAPGAGRASPPLTAGPSASLRTPRGRSGTVSPQRLDHPGQRRCPRLVAGVSAEEQFAAPKSASRPALRVRDRSVRVHSRRGDEDLVQVSEPGPSIVVNRQAPIPTSLSFAGRSRTDRSSRIARRGYQIDNHR